MKFKDTKHYLSLTRCEINQYIEHILQARNVYLEQDKPIEDINSLLEKFIKLRKKLRA